MDARPWSGESSSSRARRPASSGPCQPPKARRITGANAVAAKAKASPTKRPASASSLPRPAASTPTMAADENGGLRLGTDFGGMDTPLLALQTAGYKVRHVFNCEKNLSCNK
eukprot:8574291-Pyramimonas_sp.AAC.1